MNQYGELDFDDVSCPGTSGQELSDALARCDGGSAESSSQEVFGLGLSFGAYSDRGGRRRNEDSFLITDAISCVSDGIGGAEHGDVMSKLACSAVCGEWDSLPGSEMSAEERMRRSILGADSFLTKVGMGLGGGPGATIVAVASAGGALVFGAVGDSRAFVLDERGLLSVFPETGREADAGNALSAALGYGMLEGGYEPRVTSLRVSRGARVLLCTDGVWTSLSERRLRSTLSASGAPWQVARSIVKESVGDWGRGHDNATALVGMPCNESSAYGESTPVSTRL